MRLSRADYYEFVARVARAGLAQAQASAIVEKAQRPLVALMTRLVSEYPDFPARGPRWRWNDETLEIVVDGEEG